MLTVLSILGVLAVLFAAAAVATREGPILLDAPADIADVVLPPGPLQPEDLNSVRFGLAIRGYRMDEVDRVLERAATEIGERDARIAELLHSGAGHRVEPAEDVTPTEEPAPTPAATSASPVAIKPVGATSEPLVPAMPVDSAEALDSFEDEPAESTEADSPAPVEPDGSAEADEPLASLLGDSDAADEQPLEPPAPPPLEVAVVPLETAPLPSTVTIDPPPPAGDKGDADRD